MVELSYHLKRADNYEQREKMLSSFTEIKDSLAGEHFEYVLRSTDSQGYLSELADAEIPIYTQEIIDEWDSLRSEDTDRWQECYTPSEIGDNKTSIIDLMRIDLFLFYDGLYAKAWEQVKEEKGVIE